MSAAGWRTRFTVTMSAAIIEVKGRKIRYSVGAYNDAGAKIGRGTQWRAIVGPFFAQPPHVEHFNLLAKSD